MSAAGRRRKEPPVEAGITTQYALGEAVGRSDTVICQCRKRSDWPVSKYPPWNAADVEKLREYFKVRRAKALLGGNNQPDDPDVKQLEESPERQAKLRILIAKASRFEFQQAVLEGRFIPKQRVEEDRARRILAVKGAMLSHARRMAPLLVGVTDVRKVEKLLHEDIVDMLEQFAGKKPSTK